MTITIKLFGRGDMKPRFIATLVESELSAKITDLKFLWDVERAINDANIGRCHIEVEEGTPSASDVAVTR